MTETEIGWQHHFPMPNSLYNSEFRRWAHGLDRTSQLMLRHEMLVWLLESLDDRNGEIATRFRQNTVFRDHFDTFIGNLTFDKDPSRRNVDLLHEGKTFRINARADYIEAINQRARELIAAVEAGRALYIR